MYTFNKINYNAIFVIHYDMQWLERVFTEHDKLVGSMGICILCKECAPNK